MKHEFVKNIPEFVEENKIYISIEFCVAVHKCCCGCGKEVVTPLSPTDWKVTFDGDSISLYPSIGNWSFDCRSHYWITRNEIIWAEKWDDDEIIKNRIYDKENKSDYYQKKAVGNKKRNKKKKKKRNKSRISTLLNKIFS
ncbi:MAG: hypothetical protein JXN63_03525 [Candidatus Delongbacteria bacterium]|nr:hypothetical protein [Candidatus Delongbacteria bacterium]